MANARQVTLRARLRNFYWVTDCRPIGPDSLALLRKKMSMIDAKDEMSEAEVSELLTAHYGFVATTEGLITIPELDEARGVAIGAAKERTERAGAGGRAKAAKAKESQAKTTPPNDPHDF